MRKTPQIHGGRADDYYYVVSGKKNTKIYYSKILDCKIAKGEIDKSFIENIKEQLPSEKYKDIVNLIDKRTKLEEKAAALANKIVAINDQLSNLGIATKEDAAQVEISLKESIKEKSERRAQFDAERDAILRGTFMSNGWQYHGVKTGINLHPQKSGVPDPKDAHKPDYQPKPGNFNYHDDDSSESDFFTESHASGSHASGSSQKSYQKNVSHTAPICESKYSYSSAALTSRGIFSRKLWLKWLKEHHVDKGGDEQICSEVITAGRAKGW